MQNKTDNDRRSNWVILLVNWVKCGKLVENEVNNIVFRQHLIALKKIYLMLFVHRL